MRGRPGDSSASSHVANNEACANVPVVLNSEKGRDFLIRFMQRQEGKTGSFFFMSPFMDHDCLCELLMHVNAAIHICSRHQSLLAIQVYFDGLRGQMASLQFEDETLKWSWRHGVRNRNYLKASPSGSLLELQMPELFQDARTFHFKLIAFAGPERCELCVTSANWTKHHLDHLEIDNHDSWSGPHCMSKDKFLQEYLSKFATPMEPVAKRQRTQIEAFAETLMAEMWALPKH